MNTVVAKTTRFSRIEDAELFLNLLRTYLGMFAVSTTMADGTTYVSWAPQS